MKVEKVKKELYKLLQSKLPSDLTYHSIHHTKDVHSVCEFYISHYEIEKKDAELLEIAAVGHDSGFIETYANHEQASVGITSKIMRKNGYSEKDILRVSELIQATKIPQSPNTFLAQIICDADLDYLGRNDFKTIGQKLKEEWSNYELVPNIEEDFDTIQIGFLKNHFYHTDYAAEHRGPVKQRHLEELESDQSKKEVTETSSKRD